MNSDKVERTNSRTLSVNGLSLQGVVSELTQFTLDNPELRLQRFNVHSDGDKFSGYVSMNDAKPYPWGAGSVGYAAANLPNK